MNIKTSAEQLYHGAINYKPEKGKDKRLFIDLDICAKGQCDNCALECSYYYHQQAGSLNNGIVPVAELATYALVCRRCEAPHCVASCPKEALEQQSDKEKLLIRHNMRCVSCKSCSHACPYGTIYPENVPLLTHNCDFCFDRRQEKSEPLCVLSCKHKALRLEPADIELGKDTFLVGDNLIVHSTHWEWEKA